MAEPVTADLAALLATLEPAVKTVRYPCDGGPSSCLILAYTAESVAVLAQACLDAEKAFTNLLAGASAAEQDIHSEFGVGPYVETHKYLIEARAALASLRAATGNNAGDDT